jgi:hypothetical protein
MSERRTPYRAPRRRPLEPQAPLRHLAPLPPCDERAVAEQLLADLTAYYSVHGWRGVDGALAGRCRITIQALLGALEAAQRRQQGASLEQAARAVKAAFEAVGRCEDEFLPDYPEACGEWRDALDLAITRLITALPDQLEQTTSETEGSAHARSELGTVATAAERRGSPPPAAGEDTDG